MHALYGHSGVEGIADPLSGKYRVSNCVFSTPVLMHGGFMCTAVCLSVCLHLQAIASHLPVTLIKD